jgi:hypothetical protein
LKPHCKTVTWVVFLESLKGERDSNGV